MNTRRAFVQEMALLSALAAAAAEDTEAQNEAGRATREFWDGYFDIAERTDDRATRDSGVRVDPRKIPNFLLGTNSGLRFSSDIKVGEMLEPPPPERDVVITLTPGVFRPSTDDHNAIQRSRGSQVRLDWFQKQPIMNLVAPMAWAGLAAWSPSRKDPATKKASAAPIPPDLTNMSFRDPNAPDAPANNQVILMGGSGKMAVNVTAVRKNDKVDAALKATVNYSSLAAPYFGFAPLAIPALRAFTELIGYLYHRESIILNSVPANIVATQTASNADTAPGKLKLVDGHYLAVPDEHVDRLNAAMSQLRIDDTGWLVHQDADKNLKPADRGMDPRVPDATYMSMNVKITLLSEAVAQKAKGG